MACFPPPATTAGSRSRSPPTTSFARCARRWAIPRSPAIHATSGVAARLRNVEMLQPEIVALSRKFERDDLVARLRARQLAAGPGLSLRRTDERSGLPGLRYARQTCSIRRRASGLSAAFRSVSARLGPIIGRRRLSARIRSRCLASCSAIRATRSLGFAPKRFYSSAVPTGRDGNPEKLIVTNLVAVKHAQSKKRNGRNRDDATFGMFVAIDFEM